MVVWKGVLTDLELEEIKNHVPDVASFQHRTSNLTPNGVSFQIMAAGSRPDHGVPIAAVCFIDLGRTLLEAGYALFQCLAHGCYHRKPGGEAAEIQALLLEKYYADDAALRLYSAGEHLAEAIVQMLGITTDDLQSFRGKKVSLQGAVGRYLTSQRVGHPVTEAISQLAASADWESSRTYRDDWVHNQPHLIEGLGLQFRRRSPLQVSGDGKTVRLNLGGRDPAHHTIGEVKGFLESALRELLAASVACLDYYDSRIP